MTVALRHEITVTFTAESGAVAGEVAGLPDGASTGDPPGRPAPSGTEVPD